VSRRGPGGPVGLSSFVGRRTDLRQARRLLGGSRLVTLVGPGGVGKTRLAARLADEVSRVFPDGTFVIELAELHDPESVLTELASLLGVEDAGASHQAAVTSFLRRRRLLLVLDNCEHVVEDAARLVRTLLLDSSGLSVVATSRQPLGVPGEQLMVVEPLSLPATDSKGRVRVADSEAVELFVERARLVAPGFALTADNTALVAQVCTMLDGMPLAIELAAARLRMLSLAQLADRLHDRFGVLAVALTAAVPRHQTLRASVDWSFELCSPGEQRLWAWMSVFDGGCDLDAVEAVCAGTGIDVFGTVAGLVDKSVLTPQEAAGRVRYRMLDTIRTYGRERLAERGDTDALTQAHRAYFVGFARSAGQSWFGPDQRDRMARTAAEHANLRAAFEACLRSPTPDARQDALTICTSIWWFWVGHGGLDELVRWLCRALDPAFHQPPTALTLHALTRTAFLAAMRGDQGLLATYAERAVELTVDDDPQVRWDRRWARTLLDSLSGDRESYSELSVEALHDDPPPGPHGPQETVNVLVALAQRRFWTGRPAEALDHVDQGIEICRRHGDEWNLSFFLCLRGSRLADLGHHEEALAAEREALRLARGGFHSWTVVLALEFAAQVFSELRQGMHAAVLFGAVTSLWPDIGGVLLLSDQPRHAALEEQARGLLGAQQFERAFERGRRMSLDSVVAFVLDEDSPPPRDGASGPGPGTTALTKRELEVAELVARGLSNKEIASALVVSPRTAEGHVARLLDKLGFESRARVAAWVAERRAGGGWPDRSDQE
jgi:predicted ATPase/DNA-binding CsgD family transcriptional regulator